MNIELVRELRRLAARLESEICNWEQMAETIAEWQKQGEEIGNVVRRWLAEGAGIRAAVMKNIESSRERQADIYQSIQDLPDIDDADWWKGT